MSVGNLLFSFCYMYYDSFLSLPAGLSCCCYCSARKAERTAKGNQLGCAAVTQTRSGSEATSNTNPTCRLGTCIPQSSCGPHGVLRSSSQQVMADYAVGATRSQLSEVAEILLVAMCGCLCSQVYLAQTSPKSLFPPLKFA